MLKVLAVAAVVGVFFGLVAYSLSHLITENRITPVVNDMYFNAAYSSIRAASSSVHIVMFTMKYYPDYEGNRENKLLDALKAAKQRGVDVKIVLEGGSSYLGEAFGSDQRQACSYLDAGGVEVRFDPGNVTTHAKLLIADGRTVIVGSTNWNYQALEQNNEASVLLNDPATAAVYEDYFRSIWSASEDCGAALEYRADQESPAYGACGTASDILSNRGYCDGREVVINGTVSGIQLRTSKKGSDYSSFSVGRLNVFSWGHTNVTNGQWVVVRGIYSKENVVGEYTFRDEIEASEITALSP